jgi:hypothetical protein
VAYDLIVIGASLGGQEALTTVLSALPADFPLPVVIVQHRGVESDDLLCLLLQTCSALPVREAEDKVKKRERARALLRLWHLVHDIHTNKSENKKQHQSCNIACNHSYTPLISLCSTIYRPATIRREPTTSPIRETPNGNPETKSVATPLRVEASPKRTTVSPSFSIVFFMKVHCG